MYMTPMMLEQAMDQTTTGGPGGPGPRVILICIVLALIALLFLRRCA